MDCKQGTSIIIEQIVGVLNQLSDQQYQTPLEIFSGSTLGQHFRHILDFYNCLLAGLPENSVDYEKRPRNFLIETNTTKAAESFRFVTDRINGLEEERKIDIQADFAEKSLLKTTVQSTIGRELLYAYDHAIHHLAMIRMGIQTAFPDVQINAKIGIAPSTLKHWQSNN